MVNFEEQNMKHQISFRDVETGWDNALPLGNGKMGASIYYKDRSLYVALNHYDCYYQILQQYAKDDEPLDSELSYAEMRMLTDSARKEPDYERSHYIRTLNPGVDQKRPQYEGSSHPQGGELVITFSEKVDIRHTFLSLSIEEARVTFRAGTGNNQIEAYIYVSRQQDGVVLNLRQIAEGLWESAKISRQMSRGKEGYSYEDRQTSEMISMLCRFRPKGESEHTIPFAQETAFYLPGALANGSLKSEGNEFSLVGSICPGEGKAQDTARMLWKKRDSDQRVHWLEWKKFWKSTVMLPDSYLETLWHLYVYLLECCSGKGSIHSEQACGLSGLWDIRKPCMWGSLWYWDVNIQSSFYGTFASNHMELAKVFCDGFLSYEEKIKAFAKRFYKEAGWALDYPHPLYQCIQPWCALFLWQYYAYTGDEVFLGERAYPVFCEIIRFYRKIGRVDEEGIRHIDYDICPEQGPVTRDSTITTASLKQLIVYAAKAAKILKRPEKELQELGQLLSEMPEYAITKDGLRWKDSTLAADDVFLRHPSVLMPVFPAKEVHMESSVEQRNLAENTIRYAAENTEPGTFGPTWIASAAARMGSGESAVRILYEKGLDFMTHSNGLGYEESERFINYCHLTKPANYLPVMCEFSGSVTETINLMLLQEMDGVLHVFPALPDGCDRYAVPKTEYAPDDARLSKTYGPWKDCAFEGMLAPGGFEVSAQMQKGKITWISIFSKKGGELKLWLPQELSGEKAASVCFKDMKSGDRIDFGKKETTQVRPIPEVLMHQAAQTHRRTFIGENKDTAFYKAIDAFVCPYGFADTLYYPMTPYVFDFTDLKDKDYDGVYEPQLLQAGRSIQLAGGPRPISAVGYLADRGYGFMTDDGIALKDRRKPDILRRDFVQGETPVEFGVELPAGKYDLLVISGDEEEPSYTELAVTSSGIYAQGEELSAGAYQYKALPLIHSRDGILKLSVNTKPNSKWKINAIFINKRNCI